MEDGPTLTHILRFPAIGAIPKDKKILRIPIDAQRLAIVIEKMKDKSKIRPRKVAVSQKNRIAGDVRFNRVVETVETWKFTEPEGHREGARNQGANFMPHSEYIW